jgi:hypothetical protein
MDTEKTELWERLENEPERAYRAFEAFLSLPGRERTLTAAYQHHVSNPDARPSDTWNRWSNEFAWRERAAAYDDHLASVRREAHEQVIKEEAERQAREVEKTRGRFNELMTVAYMQAMEALEDEDWVRDNLRASDAIRIIGLHMDAVKAFEADREPKVEADWTEEDEAAAEQILREIDARRHLEHPDLGLEEWEGSEEGSDEEHSEDSEGEEP